MKAIALVVVISICVLAGIHANETNVVGSREEFVPPPHDEASHSVWGLGCYSAQNKGIVAVFQTLQERHFVASRPILVGLMSVDGIEYNVLPLAPAYGYRVRAESETGAALTPTPLGRTYGQHFDDVKGFDERALVWTGPDGEKRKRPLMAAAPVGGASTVCQFPAPQDLFQFPKPGKYIVWVELQCLSRPIRGTSTNWSVVRLPPVKLRVVKDGKE